MANLEIWNKVREVPKEAQKLIKGGRLAGYTDINPMWRLKTLTNQFGLCGFGWKYEITDKWLEKGANDEISAFVEINLFIKQDNEWSAAIPGTGGSSFVAKETRGLYTSDECFKMALTDAIGVACKALGVGADVYWEKDNSKYDGEEKTPEPKPKPKVDKPAPKSKTKQETTGDTEPSGRVKMATKEQIDEITRLAKEKYGDNKEEYKAALKTLHEMGKISTPFPIDRNKNIKWTVEDYKAVKEDLEIPF